MQAPFSLHPIFRAIRKKLIVAGFKKRKRIKRTRESFCANELSIKRRMSTKRAVYETSVDELNATGQKFRFGSAYIRIRSSWNPHPIRSPSNLTIFFLTEYALPHNSRSQAWRRPSYSGSLPDHWRGGGPRGFSVRVA